MKKNNECLELANEILKNWEMSELSYKSILLKCLRLYRLLNNEEGSTLFKYETSGYPRPENGLIEREALEKYCKISHRKYTQKNMKGERENYNFTNLVSSMVLEVDALKIALQNTTDPNISISSANPNQYIFTPHGNTDERTNRIKSIEILEDRIAKVTGALYEYVLNTRNALEYENVVTDGINHYKELVDNELVKYCPESLKKFLSTYENLKSQNKEDWANAVHSCRRILKDLADSLFPANSVPANVKGKEVIIDDDHYINRLMQFLSNSIGLDTTKSIVGSTLQNVGERIDAIYESSNKGTHANVTKKEAERYIIYTYLLVGDILLIKDGQGE
ncbi:MAG: hypothetical protein PHY11_00725 [Bacilli bacterium]|nr:hypothetical protein [Bacilli bacterium]